MKDYLEIKFWKLAIYIIRKGYGADCPASDLEWFYKHVVREETFADKVFSRCASCKAKETIDWIEGHIELINS